LIISKTPLRISFAGGGTDLRSYYKKNRYGAVLSTSINKYLYVTIKTQSTLFKEKYRFNYSETELVDELESIKNPIIRECIRFLEIDENLYISTIADAPASSGLGSSSVFCVGLLNGLYKLKCESVSAGRLAEEAAHIECDILKRPMGKQDHYAAAYGGVNYIRFYDDETVTIRHINLSSKNLNLFFDSIVLFWTGLTRGSESVLKEQNANSVDNTNGLTKMKNQALELSNILSCNEISIKRVGELLNQGWDYKKNLASNISNSSIDKWYEKAILSGAYGGKISGAGAGGFLSLIVPKEKKKNIISVMEKAGLEYFPLNADTQGTKITLIN